MALDYNEELEAALRAVHRASIVTKNVMNGIESHDKKDASPVTMADFAAQALIICGIHKQFPNDRFIAEESADMLRGDEELLNKVWDLVHHANAAVTGFSNELPIPKNAGEMMEIIDLGSKGETPSSGRVWILDPIDGTATFLKGQQYVVCLSLTIDGKQKVGVLGCPNLKPEQKLVEEQLVDKDGYGVLLGAVFDHGAFMTPISKGGLAAREQVRRLPASTEVSELQLIDSVKSSHAHLPSHQKVFEGLRLRKKIMNIWSMQIKYVALALGTCDAMIRIPLDRNIRASIWDHAGGQLIYTESGGKITDLDGHAFDFAKGREFGVNWGFVAADKEVHDAVFGIVRGVLDSTGR